MTYIKCFSKSAYSNKRFLLQKIPGCLNCIVGQLEQSHSFFDTNSSKEVQIFAIGEMDYKH